MTTPTFETLKDTLRATLAPPRPGLLFDVAALTALRERAAAHPKLRDDVLRRARDIVARRDLTTAPEPYYSSLPLLETLTAALMLEPTDALAAHTVALLRAVADAPTWVCHVHGTMRCDHCAANTAAALARTRDVLGPALAPADDAFLTERVWARCLHPFIAVCRDRSVFWAKREHQFNWRIMTCGESGLGALAFAGPDRLEAVTFALEGVADILDRVPPDGDWEEGPGYWAATLLHGLRFALALERATGGAVNLFTHPALRRTADYFIALTLPDGHVFNYADNTPELPVTVLHLLAARLRSGALAWTARRIGHRGVWDLLFDDPALPAEEPPAAAQARTFATTGIAVSRSDWGRDAVFVGVKSGPTAVGHSHLDLNSFVLQRGSVPLVIDPGIWPYGSAIGFFDSGPGGRRWDFDANATVAHNTILVDGQGQTIGPACRATFLAAAADGALRYVISDAAAAYPGLLTRCERWLVHLLPDTLLVYDDLAADVPRRWEWLVHPAGTWRDEGRAAHVIENAGVRVTLTRLLPAADLAWRHVAETRTSYYEDSDFNCPVERSIVGHRLGPMQPAKAVEFLWVLRVAAASAADAPSAAPTPAWSVARDGDALVLRGPVTLRLDKAARMVTQTSR